MTSSTKELPPFAVSLRDAGEEIVSVSLAGELDLATGAELRQHLERHLTNGHRVVYDLSQLSFIDAAGVSALLAPLDDARRGTVVVEEPAPMVRRVLELVGMDWMISETRRRGTG